MFYAGGIQMTEPAYTAANANDNDSSPSLATPSRNVKRERKHTAQSLPPGITQQMMKKFVVYYREFVNLKNGKRIPREYFKVESHPKLARPWVTTKSTKVSLLEKLNEANEYVTKLNEATATATATEAPPETPANTSERLRTPLPKYTMLRVIRDTPTETILSLVYDHKDTINGFRWTCSHTFVRTHADIDEDQLIQTALLELQIKLREKYDIEII
jgi:hypothetical protein